MPAWSLKCIGLGHVGVPFTKMLPRDPVVDPKKLVKHNSIVYDNIEKYEYKTTKNRRYASWSEN